MTKFINNTKSYTIFLTIVSKKRLQIKMKDKTLVKQVVTDLIISFAT